MAGSFGACSFAHDPGAALPSGASSAASLRDVPSADSSRVAASASASASVRPAASGPGEHWLEGYQSSDGPCPDYRADWNWLGQYHDPNGAKRLFGYDGYVYRNIQIRRVIDNAERLHCVRVYHPAGDRTSEGKPIAVAKKLRASWYRLLEQTLARLPWYHLQQVQAFVLDNRPLLHGIAPFNRQAPQEDARDGHTIWLNEGLFNLPNHWVHGTYGYYWAYHIPQDSTTVDKAPPEHTLYSPVLLHEIGHIVHYSVVNGAAENPDCPACSRMCGDFHSCPKSTQAQREAYCATAYCTGFGHASGTENWAEMYRWYYQSSYTRSLLEKHFPECFSLLDESSDGAGLNAGWMPPWKAGLLDPEGYHKTRWQSCKDKACKEY